MIDIFIEELKSVKDKFDWTVIRYFINNEIASIRGRLKKEVCDNGCCLHSFCPITAVYRIRTGQSYNESRAMDCDVGLSSSDKACLIKAADYICNKEIRSKLLEALDLEDR